jgi:catechol 2,3-dioxygenase-like lactoylglutathione lyase family enzyme
MLSDASIYPTIPATDLERARRCYAETLGLTPSEENPGGLFYDGAGGTRFLLYPSGGSASGAHTQIGFDVADLDAEMADLRARGATFEEYDVPGLKTVDGVADMDGVRGAWLKDSEGNLLGIAEITAR